MPQGLVWLTATAIALLASATPAQADVITDWNMQLRNAIRQHASGPPDMARSGAMVMTAMYNAVNAIDQTHQSYGGFNVHGDPGTSREAAAAQAAYEVMQSLYPSLGAQWSTQLATSLAAVPDGAAKAAGISLGSASASHMIALRSNDGTQLPNNYLSGSNPGDYVNPNVGQPGYDRNYAVEPNAGNYTPWTLASGSQFRPNFLTHCLPSCANMADFLASPVYTQAFAEVKSLGQKGRWQPGDQEYDMAFFWANDRNGTFKPPGHLNAITQTISQRELGNDQLSENARLFALLNLALADAGIAAWDAKYNTDLDLWRPITGIRNADLDGNPDTIADANWEPMNNIDPDGGGSMSADPFTPPFPAFISGHATFGAAHAAIMERFFGNADLIQGGALTIDTDDPYMPGVTRTFSSWEAMARENARSRVYLGVHWQFDADDGYSTGSSVGDWVFDHYLLAIPEPDTGALLVAGALFGLRQRKTGRDRGTNSTSAASAALVPSA